MSFIFISRDSGISLSLILSLESGEIVAEGIKVVSGSKLPGALPSPVIYCCLTFHGLLTGYHPLPDSAGVC